MFSSHLPKMNTVPREYLFAGIGLVIVISLLVGIASVASAQVRKAELRDSMLASQRSAMASCVATLGGVELNKCLIQARAEPDRYSRPTTLADNSGGFSRNTTTSSSANAGFMPVMFSTHR